MPGPAGQMSCVRGSSMVLSLSDNSSPENVERGLMNAQLDVRTAVLIVLGIAAGCLAYRSPEFGIALTVGFAAAALLHLLLKDSGEG